MNFPLLIAAKVVTIVVAFKINISLIEKCQRSFSISMCMIYMVFDLDRFLGNLYFPFLSLLNAKKQKPGITGNKHQVGEMRCKYADCKHFRVKFL